MSAASKKLALKYLHHWHDFTKLVNGDTKIYFVDDSVVSVLHECPAAAAGRVSTRRSHIIFQQPSYDAVKAGGCVRCNRLWIAKEPPDGDQTC